MKKHSIHWNKKTSKFPTSTFLNFLNIKYGLPASERIQILLLRPRHVFCIPLVRAYQIGPYITIWSVVFHWSELRISPYITIWSVIDFSRVLDMITFIHVIKHIHTKLTVTQVKEAHNTVIITFFRLPNTLSTQLVREVSTPEFTANSWARVCKPAKHRQLIHLELCHWYPNYLHTLPPFSASKHIQDYSILPSHSLYIWFNWWSAVDFNRYNWSNPRSHWEWTTKKILDSNPARI